MVLIRTLPLTLAIFSIALGSVVAADFARYPAEVAFKGKRAPLRLRDAQSRRLASALADAAENDVNFDGHYVLTEIGCGAGCVKVAAIDASTGRISWLGASVSNWPKTYAEPIGYKVESRLIAVHGQLAENGSADTHFFLFNGKTFKPLRK